MWICPKCREVIEDQFDSCWRCAGEGEKTETPGTSDIGTAARRSTYSDAKKIVVAVIYTGAIGGFAFVLSLSDLATGRTWTAPYLFPYAYWFGRLFADGDLFMLCIFAQFPIYGITFAWAWLRHHHVKAVVWIVLVHILFAFSLAYLINFERQYRI